MGSQLKTQAADETDIEVLTAQASSVLQGVKLSLLANSVVAVSASAILYDENTSGLTVYWLAAVVAVNLVRLVLTLTISRLSLTETHPGLALNLLTISSFVSGSMWAAVPFFVHDFAAAGSGAFIAFIVAGISAGSLIQSAAYAKISIAFMAPQLISVCISFYAANQMATTFVGFNATLFTIMMLRSALQSEKQFVQSVKTALQAGRLATSLKYANEAISNTNRQLEQLANHDALTKLSSRSRFNAALHERMVELKQSGVQVSLMVCDLDKFKAINDTFGHPAGDQVLIEFAHRMLVHIQPGELAARLGGDEFAIITTGPEAPARAAELADKILAASLIPVEFAGNQLKTGASIGIATAPADASGTDDLFRCADAALYKAKELGRRRVQVFNASLQDQITRNSKIESGLSAAIRYEQLRVEFQPQVKLSDKSISGFEALLRWDHPTLGPIAPEEIAQAARNTQNSLLLTSFVTKEACRLLNSLEDRGIHDITIAVNISPLELSTKKTALELYEIVKQHGVAPSRIEFEITEESLLDAKAAKRGLATLEEAGFLLAVDDFGMGYSSLSYLIDNRIDRLKIDRKFVRNVATSPKNQALVAALVSASKALSMDVLAEGVETDSDAEALRLLGCKMAQGFLYGRAMPRDSALAILDGREPSGAFTKALEG